MTRNVRATNTPVHALKRPITPRAPVYSRLRALRPYLSAHSSPPALDSLIDNQKSEFHMNTPTNNQDDKQQSQTTPQQGQQGDQNANKTGQQQQGQKDQAGQQGGGAAKGPQDQK